MSRSGKVAVAAVAAAIVLFWAFGVWGLVALVAVPAVAYLLLDPSQRRRLRGTSRKQLGR
ncbi:hypothetical protein [Streptomyces sp. NPDC001568]|uniref:hypothetical protein n=1 Tax=Streptomyces sp. NPDC001568 TaxID=3364588 RepID=UPI00368DB493